MIKAGIIGLGKTGQHIAKSITEQEDIKLVTAICRPGSNKAGKDIGALLGCEPIGLAAETSDNLEDIIFRTRPDVMVDFSSPSATIKNSRLLARMKVNLVIGTTGFTEEDLEQLYGLARKYRIGIVYAPNITLGVNTLMLLGNIAANILNNYDFQITEIHHKHKKDSPSGTAIKISEEIKRGLLSSGNKNKAIPINAVRAGGVVGKHEIMIIGEEDKIEISHESFSRKAFAEGAIKAINFIHKRCGYFEMSDVLDLKRVLSAYMEDKSINF